MSTGESTNTKKGFRMVNPVPGVRAYIDGISNEPRTRYLTVLWGFCFIFLGITLLSSSNPFRLLIPGAVFPRPILDGRQATKVFGVQSDLTAVIPVSRLMQPDANVPKRVRRIAFLVSRPPGLRERSTVGAADLAPMPNLGLAIRKVWYANKNNAGSVVIDMRGEGITNELFRFMKARRASTFAKSDRKSRRKQRRVKADKLKLEARYLDGWFRALAASALASEGVRSITFLVDGRSIRYGGMSFDLRREYTTGASDSTGKKSK